MKYRIILGGNAPNSKNIFTSQKKITRLMVGIKPRNSEVRGFNLFHVNAYSH
jgi:hypothetical protein